MINPISIYIHIPFCTHKCAYCHFYVLPDKDPFKAQLQTGLKQEWKLRLPLLQSNDNQIVSIYFGGGTPSLLGASAIGEILNWIRSDISLSEDAEITLEANPENISRTLMEEYAKVGINRVSIGIQTFDPQLLKILERLHTSHRAMESIWQTAEAGIFNISIDLMYDLPHQTLLHWRHTLNEVQKLPITHLSLYNLTIEPHTAFFKNQHLLAKQLPKEEESLEMYQMAIDLLGSYGLHQYEISAFCKNNLQSRHNVGYWTAREFLGFGPSAFSYWDGKRFRNIANLNKYCKLLEEGRIPVDFHEELLPEAHIRELLTIQLRLLEGVNLVSFQEHHGSIDQDTLAVIEKLKSQDFIVQRGPVVALTGRGILFYDTVASELI